LFRSVPFLLLLAVATVSTASAADPATRNAPQEAPASVTAERETPQRDTLDQGAIYRILCGGTVDQDVVMQGTGLSQHLWTVAGSLAEGQWKPPVVTIRVVVSDPATEE